MRTLNLGILAHVDAGKTSLTERLLYAAGVIDEVGRVDDGSTQTDSLALEQQRGITIRSAVVSFVIDDVTVNLIDTPGHPDFIAEVERVLNVLDGAVLVISAVEGVQAQTRVLMRTLQRLRIPTLIFVNKIDRTGARDDGVLQEVAEKLTSSIIAMGSTNGLGTRDASVTPYGESDAAFATSLADLLGDHNDTLLAAYVDDDTLLSYGQLRTELAAQTKQALVHPAFSGSAITGAGVDALIAGLKELLPATEGDVDAPATGTVFKIERGPAGEKVAYVRMFSGIVHTRDRLHFRDDSERKVTAISVFERGLDAKAAFVAAGQIGKLWGLGDVQIGDAIGGARSPTERHHFAPPTLESVIVPRNSGDKAALHIALTQLAEQDPLINLRQDDERQEMSVSLYGEVQKQVIEATLANDFNIDIEFRETKTICIERPVGVGTALEVLRKNHNPFLATVGLRIEPAPVNAGVVFRLDVDVRTVPLYVYKTVDEFRDSVERVVRETLRQGLYGWQVTDCTVTMTDSGYLSPATKAADVRKLTPLVLMSALKQAGTEVCEPMHRFHLEIPADTFAATLSVLARLRALPQDQVLQGSSYVLEGDIQAARVHELQQRLGGLTRGEGVLECVFDHYEPVSGDVPTKPRSDNNPLNRQEYLMHLSRRA